MTAPQSCIGIDGLKIQVVCISISRYTYWPSFLLLFLPLRERTVPIDAANTFLCSRVMGEALGARGSS
jgi:hypothetical protein